MSQMVNGSYQRLNLLLKKPAKNLQKKTFKPKAQTL